MNSNIRTTDHIRRCYEKLRLLFSRQPNIEHVVAGVKGIPIFHEMLPYWSMVDMQTLDVMHLFEGVHNLLINLWTEKIYNNGISPRISCKAWQRFDALLCCQKLPAIFHRKVRSIIKDGKYWKASECLVFHLLSYEGFCLSTCFNTTCNLWNA